VKLDKGDFVGKAALLKRHAMGAQRKLVTLDIKANHAPAHPGASVMTKEKVVGTITSGAFGHRVGLNLAYAFVDPNFAATGSTLVLDLCGAHVAVQVIDPSPYDPTFSRMRS
ncbi:MAG: glycine cleavage T C-terminal barrel domain-containing protein, partial [Paracoccaceae bacterium]